MLLSLYIGKTIGSDALLIGWFVGFFVYIFLIYITRYNIFKVNLILVLIFIILFTIVLFNLKEIIYFIDGGPSSSDVRISLIINVFNNLEKMIYFGFATTFICRY